MHLSSFGKFWDFLKELWTYVNNDRIFAVSAGVAFYGLLSLVPGIAALISVYGLFTTRATVVDHISKIAQVFPAEIASIIGDQALRIANQPPKSLGIAVLISFTLSLWSSNSATKSTFDALNVAFETRERRGTIGLNLQTIGFTLAGLLFALLAIAATVVVPLMLKYVWLTPFVVTLFQTLTWPIFLVVVSLAIATLYRFGPSHTDPRWRWATPGVVFATATWGGMSFLFSWYAASFGKFNETYGSLGAAAVLMTWLWLSALLVLIGAEIDSIFYDQPHPEPSQPII
ncbi:MAG: YihY/virulence factor BrkB family protein [Pseudomonadota bacterium]|nr:YihY/virulence factor BrkB family protein [Pseudomonadota bacterium]